jgi:8-oxo-dGTP pyrophosphatase MutT (NUDIX family)
MGDVRALLAALDAFSPRSADEARDVAQVRDLAGKDDPWSRSTPLHLTASALVVHPPTRRVLLRWHERMQSWLQVGGHGAPGEHDPYAIALREAEEETGLYDLIPWPGPTPALLQVVIVPVPPGKGEPAHQHADLRYALATAEPDRAAPELEGADVAWLGLDEAIERVVEENLRICLGRIGELLG